jgi:hypothetical protein
MKVTRRDLLVWSAGAAAGLLVTPVPWKVLDDVSIWSQNWPWIPQPSRGPVEAKQSFCTLCPKGCGMRVRLAGGWPVGVAGMKSHPISGGALCPLAFGAHQLNWHPQRLRTVRHHGSASSWSEAQTAFAKACREGSVVIIDGYPGRAASSVLETFANQRHGNYRVVVPSETQALTSYETWSGVPASALGYDLENAQTIVSFGAPLLDGWGSPGRFARIWAEHAASLIDPQVRLIQIEASFSRTSGRAWRWIPIHKDADAALAAGLARVLIEERMVPALSPMPAIALSDAAAQTGLAPDAIRELARTIIARAPVVAIPYNDNPSIAALNIVLGAIGSRGGIVRRAKTSRATVSADAAIPNARAVLIDSSVPWDFVPQTDAEVFRFAAWDGGSSNSDWLLPAPGFLEELTDVPTAPTSSVESYAVAPSLSNATSEVRSAAEFLAHYDSTLVPVEKIIHTRCQELFHKRIGSLHGQELTLVSSLDSVQKLEEQLWKGAVWVGQTSPQAGFRCDLKEWPHSISSARIENSSRMWPTPVLPPLASKLYVESSLRQAPDRRKA